MTYLWELHDQIKSAEKKMHEAEGEVMRQKKALVDLMNKAWFCPDCRKYYALDDCGRTMREETNTEITYTDAGYGDNDEIAEVTRSFTYIICPVCGHQEQLGPGLFLREKNNRPRRG